MGKEKSAILTERKDREKGYKVSGKYNYKKND